MILDTLMANSIALNKLDSGKELDVVLEKGGYALGGSRTMSDMVPELLNVSIFIVITHN